MKILRVIVQDLQFFLDHASEGNLYSFENALKASLCSRESQFREWLLTIRIIFWFIGGLSGGWMTPMRHEIIGEVS